MKKLLLFAVLFIAYSGLTAQDCANLFISEYVEGSANNKTLEIYNPTNNAVNLSTFVIKRYSNGSPIPTEELILSGTIQPKDAVVVTNGQTDSIWVQNGGYWSLPISEELYNLGDLHCSGIYPTPMYFNGDDAMTLETTTGGVVDIFGKIGEQPENGWNDIPPSYTAGAQFWTSWTEDQTLIRKPSVKSGVTSNPSLFMVHVEWDSIPEDTFDSLGFHHCDCNTLGIEDRQSEFPSVVIYPNPASGRQLNVDVSGDWKSAEIISLAGQSVRLFEKETAVRKEVLDISGLEEGIYFLKISFEKQSPIIHKIMVR